MKLPFYCKFCDTKEQGILFRERYRWRAKLSCGHYRNLGFVLPPDELQRRGIINYDVSDPRVTAMREAKARDALKERIELAKRKKTIDGMTRGKFYL